MMQRTANENAARKRRICKRFDQPKIDRIAHYLLWFSEILEIASYELVVT